MKFTIKEFHAQYPDDKTCLEAIFKRRFGYLKCCPSCERETNFYRVTTRRCYVCQWCGHQIYPTKGTPFEKTTTSLKHWFYAMYLMTATRSGVSAKELERQLGVTYKTAWRMAHQIRLLMSGKGKMLQGVVEADETYVGGAQRGGKRGRGSENKTPVIGILERGGSVVAKVAGNVKTKTVLPNILANVEKGATICSDELRSYNPIGHVGFVHVRVSHGAKEYVRGIAHTNSIEGFWSRLKNSISGTHVWVSKKHLQKYINEFAFRYNERKSETPMFHSMLANVSL